MSRKERLSLVRRKQAQSRTENGHLKRDERVRRDRRIIELVKTGTFPYTPAIRSWLSVKIGKRSNDITQDDIRMLIAATAKSEPAV